MAKPTLEDRILGGLLGSAVGDALGAPTECMHYKDIEADYGDFQNFEDLAASGRQPFHPIGSVTDDTVLSDLLLEAILESEGQMTAHTFARAWAEKFEAPVEGPDGRTIVRLDHVHWIERIPFLRNRLREINKRELGHGEANATNAIMYIAPVGLLCAGDPLKAELMAVDVTAVNQHGGPRDVAGGYCAALAACFLPDAAVESIVRTAVEHTRDERHTREIRAMLEVARTSGGLRDFIERYYTEILGPVLPMQDLQHLGSRRKSGRPTCTSWNSSEVLGPALAAFLITGGADARAMMLACAKIGRDADTICRVGGGLAGAWLGAGAIPKEWADYVLERNAWLRIGEKAERLAALVRRNLERDIRLRQSVLATWC